MTVQEDCGTLVRNILVVVADEGGGADLCRRLTATDGLRCCGVASTLADGIDMLRPGSVQGVIVGDGLPDAGVWNAVRAFRDLDPHAAVVVLASGPGVEPLREARWAGAAGFVTPETPFEDIASLLQWDWSGRLFVDGDAALEIAGARPGGAQDHRAPSGGSAEAPLTPREHEVLLLLGRGLDPTSIARELGLSVHTARGHVKRILAKLGAHSQLEAVIIGVRLGLLPQLGSS
jgi:DNA-binding NarL/FixJ family response regulator